MIKFTNMFVVGFIQLAKYGVANLLPPACLRVLTEAGRVLASKEVFGPLSTEMRANILERGLPRMTSNCAVDPVSAILASARAGKTDCAAPEYMGWFLYVFTDATTILVPEWQTKSLKRGLCCNAASGVVHTKVIFRYVEDFRDDSMSRVLAKEAWSRYKA